MEIYVNGQKLNAQIGSQENLKEIYDSFFAWTKEQQCYIISMQIDKRECNLGKQALEAIDSSRVKRIDFTVGNEHEMLLSSIVELDSYIDQIGSTLWAKENLTAKEQRDLQEGLHFINQILVSISKLMGSKLESINIAAPGSAHAEAVYPVLKRLKSKAKLFAARQSREDIESFLSDLRGVKSFITSLGMQLRSILAKPEELIFTIDEFAAKIPSIKEDLAAINSNFQKAADSKALSGLEEITVQLNHYISALYAADYQTHHKNSGKGEITELAINSVSFHTKTSELTALLQDLSQALEEGDIVAVGDILEYELSAKLDSLQPYLVEISALCQSRLLESCA